MEMISCDGNISASYKRSQCPAWDSALWLSGKQTFSLSSLSLCLSFSLSLLLLSLFILFFLLSVSLSFYPPSLFLSLPLSFSFSLLLGSFFTPFFLIFPSNLNCQLIVHKISNKRMRDSKKERERDRDKERERERNRKRQREKETERDREKKREREREKEREKVKVFKTRFRNPPTCWTTKLSSATCECTFGIFNPLMPNRHHCNQSWALPVFFNFFTN